MFGLMPQPVGVGALQVGEERESMSIDAVVGNTEAVQVSTISGQISSCFWR